MYDPETERTPPGAASATLATTAADATYTRRPARCRENWSTCKLHMVFFFLYLHLLSRNNKPKYLGYCTYGTPTVNAPPIYPFVPVCTLALTCGQPPKLTPSETFTTCAFGALSSARDGRRSPPDPRGRCLGDGSRNFFTPRRFISRVNSRSSCC